MPADKLVKEILFIVNTLSEQDMGTLSGDTLSRLAVKLASLKASLGEHVAHAKRLAWDAEAEYYRVRAEGYQQLREDGKGSTDADELKRLKAHDAFIAWNKAREKSDLISNLNQSCHDLIDSVQGRLINLHTERSEANV